MRRPGNFSFIDDWVAGSAYLHEPEEVDWIAGKGIGVVISLVPLREEVRNRLSERGIEHYEFPVEDFSAPPVEELVRMVDLIRRKIVEGKRVLIHCYAGCGRTGTVLAAYMVSKGLRPDEAVERLRELRPCSIESQIQYDAVWFYYSYLMARTRSRSPRRGP